MVEREDSFAIFDVVIFVFLVLEVDLKFVCYVFKFIEQ